MLLTSVYDQYTVTRLALPDFKDVVTTELNFLLNKSDKTKEYRSKWNFEVLTNQILVRDLLTLAGLKV